jgi:hypothetical protein
VRHLPKKTLDETLDTDDRAFNFQSGPGLLAEVGKLGVA